MLIENLIILISRIFIGLLFVWAGGRKILNWHNTEDYMKTKNTKWISLLLPIAVSLQVIGGVSIIFGVYAKLGAMLLIIFILPATIKMHDFWNLKGKERVAEKAHFLKDLAIMGGLFLLILTGAGKFSIIG